MMNIGMRFTVGAKFEIAEICPGKDYNRITELFSDPVLTERNVIRLAIILNKWYMKTQKLNGEEGVPFTEEDALCLDAGDIIELQKQIIEAIRKGNHATVSVKPSKKNSIA